MSFEEWSNFRNALMQLQRLPSPNGEKDWSEWDWWTSIHLDNMSVSHGTSRFFPWHRAYVWALEERLRKLNPTVVIPYWDWTADSKNPLESPIFSPRFGLDVKVGTDGDCRYRRALFRPHCLTREYDPKNFPQYHDPIAVAAVISSMNDYDRFRQMIELVPHAQVHNTIGGRVGDMTFMNSPNDPLFFLHHSMVDYIWWLWQRQGYPSRLNAYAGDMNEVMRPFNITVADLMEIEGLCYTYQVYSRNRAIVPAK